jgi:hypothetical protein
MTGQIVAEIAAFCSVYATARRVSIYSKPQRLVIPQRLRLELKQQNTGNAGAAFRGRVTTARSIPEPTGAIALPPAQAAVDNWSLARRAARRGELPGGRRTNRPTVAS